MANLLFRRYLLKSMIMMFGPFYELFPKIGMKETRHIHIFKPIDDIPAGEYAIIDSFCTDKTCDCRRAFLHIHSVDSENLNPTPLATISYGWEDLRFYREWSPFMDDEMLLNFKGPALDSMQPQSPLANYFLQIVKDTLSNDKEYADRIKRHYAFYKQKDGMRLPPELQKLVKGMEACPCGSGKLLRMCCLKQRRTSRRRKR